MRCLSALVVLLLSAPVFAWEIPLELNEHRGNGGLRHVSGGVPLLPGQAKDVSELQLQNRSLPGRPGVVPTQFRVLARWWRHTTTPGSGDNSIRWVLVDFQTDIKPNEKMVFHLTNQKTGTPVAASPLKVTQTDDAITINTGAATFVVNRKRFSFLQSVTIDGKELLATTPECGTVIEDTFGEKYYASESTRSVEVIEQGPMRVRVRARGLHMALGGKGYSKGMYRYDYLMDFFTGSTTVFCDVIIGNNFPKSVGTPCFEDASLWLKLKDQVARYTMAGHRGAPLAGTLAVDASVRLYQDSNGAKTWNKCQGYNTERRDYWRYPADKTASFRGYKVWMRSGGKDKELATGDQATGTTLVQTANGGVVMHLLNFWQQFPKGVEVFGDGRLRLALFPREYKVNHFLEDATAKGHEVVLHFYAKDKPDPAKIAGVWNSKVLLRPSLKHIAATGALADLGPFTVPTSGLTTRPNNRTEAYGSRMLSTDGLYGNAYGWQIFGERWRSCGGHSSRGARQPMKEDNYLFRWFATGLHGWLLSGDARSRQFRDVRAYRIEDVDPFSYKDWNDFRANNRSEEWTRRPYPWNTKAEFAEEAKKYSAGRYPRSTFWLPNPAHMVLDLCYDRYLLMGDQRSFENLRTIGAHGGYYAGYRGPVVHRATGWSWRALFRYWDLTGDKDAEKLMKVCIANFKKMADGEVIKLPGRKDRKTGKQGINWWFTFVFSRAAAMAALHTGDPDAIFICKRMAETIEANKKHGGYPYRDFSELHAVLYHLTGDEKYKKEGLGPDGGERLKDVFASMKQPACAHWLLQQPPRKK